MNGNNNDESSIIASIADLDEVQNEEGDDPLSDKFIQDKDSDNEDDEDDEFKEHVSTRLYKIVVRPEQRLEFKFKFTPNDVINY